MTKNKEGETETGENPKIDLQSEMNEIHEKLELVVAKTEKFDEFAEKLQSIEALVSEMAILSNNQNKKEQKSAKKFSLRNVFEDVEDLEENQYVTSKGVEHFNAHWRIKVASYHRHLGFYICCEPSAPVGNEWSIEAKLDYRVLGRDYSNVTKTVKHCFEEYNDFEYENDLEWAEVRCFYLIDNKLTVEVDVEILKMTGFEKENLRNFDESIKECSDVVLVVKDQEFYLSKYFLGLQSSYFKSLLLGKFEESQKNKIELKDIDPDDFQNFLELIHGESSIDDDSVSGILHLADMYDVPTAIRRCEEFLLKNSQKSMVQKLQLALRCNLKNLKTKCLSEITEISDVKSIMSANLPEMDLSTSQALLQMCIDFSDK
ncbi:unnamed protein product [Caenorhabditis nigoni]